MIPKENFFNRSTYKIDLVTTFNACTITTVSNSMKFVAFKSRIYVSSIVWDGSNKILREFSLIEN